jgi:23S rRNA pseudouridine2605 synthase
VKSRKESRRTGLARALSKLGYCSRSHAVFLIRTGRVQLNGSVRRDPEFPVRLGHDRISIDGRTIEAEQKIYLAMNKPRGLVTTASDEKGRDTVYSILTKTGECLPWIAPVGRLDKASEGLLLLTNDSEWAARVASPDNHVGKTYHVQIATLADEKLIDAIIRGVETDENETLRATSCRLLRSGEKKSWIEITLDEGKNRQIRRMLAAQAIEVLRLIRVSIGPLQLGKLEKGTYRHLTAAEKLAMDRAIAAKC